jgi:hypothetical protein
METPPVATRAKNVGFWPITTGVALEPNVGFRGSAEVRVGTVR